MKNFWLNWKYLAFVTGIVLLIFITASVFDIIIAALNERFYSNAAFITIFGVAGIFAAFIGYTSGIDYAPVKNAAAKWSIIITLVSVGLLFFFLVSEIEGGEYRLPFKAFGITLALSNLFFIKEKFN